MTLRKKLRCLFYKHYWLYDALLPGKLRLTCTRCGARKYTY